MRLGNLTRNRLCVNPDDASHPEALHPEHHHRCMLFALLIRSRNIIK